MSMSVRCLSLSLTFAKLYSLLVPYRTVPNYTTLNKHYHTRIIMFLHYFTDERVSVRTLYHTTIVYYKNLY